jgi:metallo-beta-lactamase family protein
MMEAGRIKHHVANNVSDARNTILVVGYCSPSSLGARIQEPGLKEISIFGDMHPIRATITRIEAFSGHGDYQEMIKFLSCQNTADVKKLFLVHGEYATQQTYSEELAKVGFKNIEIPRAGEEFEVS